MIFCVEDDGNIRELVIYTLTNVGMAAKGFEDGVTLFEAIDNEIPQLILLDVMLPGEDGVSILKRLKASPKTKHVPVIMVTAKGAEYDIVSGLDSGADDYVTKPFGMMELVSRIKAVLRRSRTEEQQDVYESENIRLDLTKHEVYADGKQIILTLKEFDLLKHLMKSREKVLSRNVLLEEIWGYNFEGESRTLDVHIRSLRQKLGAAGEQIQTIRGVGYRLGGANEE